MAPEPDRMKARRATPGFARRRLAPEDPDGQSVGGQPGGGIDEPARRVDERPPADAVAPGRDAMVAPGGGASARPIPVSRRERPSTSVSPVDPGWEPPLDEPLQLVSVRLPASLARALDRHAQRLRDREPLSAAPRRVPKQDLFAALVWAVGDPDDGRSAERVAELYREFQARRLARAAERARAR